MSRLTRHPGFPLHWKRAMEKKQRRDAWLQSLAARDLVIVGGLVLIIGLVLLLGGK